MKKSYFILFVFCFVLGLNAQVINFPDANFKARILQSATTNYVAKNLAGNYFKIDANSDGEIEVAEALQVSMLNASYASISYLDGLENFSNLKEFTCGNNNLTATDFTNLVNLETLGCSNNQYAILDLSGMVNLKYLECNSNPIDNLNLSTNSSLEYLACNSNNLTSLNVSGLSSLRQLFCGSNHISSLNVSGLANLGLLECPNNMMTNLNISGTHLQQFNCYNNQLSSLDLTGQNPVIFYCGNNLLTSLNLSNMTNLGTLSCINNQITELNLEGCQNLQGLNCSNNFITTLNLNDLVLPQGCIEGCTAYFNVSNNNLTSLFMKGGRTDINLTFSGNPNIQYICTNEALIQDLTTKATNYGYTNCNVNSYCSFTPGGVSYTIQGNNRYDENGNGCDSSDGALPNLKFNMSSGTVSGTVISNFSGSYSIPVAAGTHAMIPVLENPDYFSISPSNVSVSFPAQSSPFTQDFCITANGIHNDLEIAVVPLTLARPGFLVAYKIIFKNNGTNTQSGTIAMTYDDPILDFLNASPIMPTQSLGELNWNFNNLHPFETREIYVNFNLNSPTDSPAVNGGDILNYYFTITGATDETPLNNSALLLQNVTNSLDPNNITCLEGTTLAPDRIGDSVHYMIRFENNGTGNAQNIVVKDVIDTAKFDVASLIPLDGSHSFVTRISQNNKVEFIFENINLPFDDAHNDGYVLFKIKTKPTLVLGNTFSNTASIYFDYNFPVVTNTATTIIAALGNSDFELSNYITLYPNPVKNALNIQVKNGIQLSSMSVYNVLGQLVLIVPNADGLNSIDVSDLKTGTYFVKINSDKGTATARFTKE
ncbi:DUF7619 domain-containing protein [Flavobacterium wongokense]|uniref:DUF7619 domain-containing protein n=1 Tax=Flavobacterium wongokense TaxID=2910674 RepID=UPI001F44678F|nr:T9SS type A sorting domain-containing protein [Flavobacterium sp. WG47]MCF6132443.1 T9SS type A sorting domain-containing protein [Flavobacterium sp. WG47]